ARTVEDLFFRRNADDQQNVSPLLVRQILREDVVEKILALHRVHLLETLRRDDGNDLIFVADLYLVRRRELLLQDSLQLSCYCHWNTPLSMNRWAASSRSFAFALSRLP